jgi:hypothetical protein
MALPKPSPDSPASDDLLDERLDDLPPLDGDDELFDGVPPEELDPTPDDAAEDAFDDQEAADLVEAEGVESLDDEASEGVEGDDARGLELGDHGLDRDEAFALGADDAEAPGVGDESFDLGEFGGGAADDRGEVGTGDEQDELEGELDEGDDVGEGLWEGTAALLVRLRSPLPPWHDASWVRLSPPSAEAEVVSVACSDGRVLAAGNTIFSVTPGALQPAASPAVSGPLVAVALEPGAPHRAVVLRASGTLVQLDESGAASPLPLGPFARGALPTHLAWARGPVVRLSSGQLFERRGEEWAELPPRGVVGLASGPGGLLMVACLLGGSLSLRISSDSAASFRTRELPPLAPSPSPPVLAVTEGAAALASGGLILLSRGNSDFAVVEGYEGVLALAFAGRGPAAPLVLVLRRDRGEPAYLASVDASGRVGLLAELAAIDAPSSPGRRDRPRSSDVADESDEFDDGAQVALAWDEARGVLWVGTRTGLAAYGPARR